jgi:hypothetical protein
VDGGAAAEVADNEANKDESKNEGKEENNKAAASDLPELLVSEKDKHEDAAEAADNAVNHQEVKLEANDAIPAAQEEADKV